MQTIQVNMEDCDDKHLNILIVAYSSQCFDSQPTTSETPGTCSRYKPFPLPASALCILVEKCLTI